MIKNNDKTEKKRKVRQSIQPERQNRSAKHHIPTWTLNQEKASLWEKKTNILFKDTYEIH